MLHLGSVTNVLCLAMKKQIKLLKQLTDRAFLSEDHEYGDPQQTFEHIQSLIHEIESVGSLTIVKICQAKISTLDKARQLIATAAADKPDGQYLVPSEVADLLRVSENKILSWIRDGRLTATNVNDTGRPSYRVHPDDIRNIATPEPTKPKRRKQDTGKDYFPDK